MIDDDDKVIGIISLSDLLFYLVLRPCGEQISSYNCCVIIIIIRLCNKQFLIF